MTVNELCSKVHLPSVVAHFAWDVPKIYRKLPQLGWYALSKDEHMTFNCIDLYRYNISDAPKNNDALFMQECYRYYTQEHPELFEVQMRYSETTENRVVNDYNLKNMTEKFYRACRAEALEGNVTHNAKSWKFTTLLEQYGMIELINTGIGLVTPRVLRCKEFNELRLQDRVDGNILLLPSFFAPNNKLASLETARLGDLSIRNSIYLNSYRGWYGSLGTNIVGSILDLLTAEGCTWNKNLAYWCNNTVLKLHHSLQPDQCIEIWTNLDNLVTDKNPISLIDKTNFVQHIRNNLSSLSISQIKELEKITGQQLHSHWLSIKTSEAYVSGFRFVNSKGRYYYFRGNNQIEYTNFIVELVRIKKEGGEFYQYGHVIMNDESVPFKIRKKTMLHQHSLISALAEVTLEAGLGIPVVAPNLKHYIPNVIEAFNPVNLIEKPKPAVLVPAAVEDQNVRVLDDL